jgi:DNA-binding transcriptional LysR family regulator
MGRTDFDERDLRSLRVFCSAAEAGGFSAAETKLGMSKTSISRHVREVEDRLGVTLCERGPGGFRLTPEGVVAITLASAAFRSLERIRPEIDAVHGVLTGRLVIGIGEHTLTHPHCRLPEALDILQTAAPKVEPQIVVMTFPELEAALLEGRADVVIRGKYRQDRGLTYLPLFTEVHQVYVSRLVKAAAGKTLPFVSRKHPYVEELLATGQYKRGPEVFGLDAVAAMIATGRYRGLLPTHYGDLIGKRFRLRADVSGPQFHHTGCAVVASVQPASQRLSLFLDILQKVHRADAPPSA